MWIILNAPVKPLRVDINLPGSKSISNRLLIIRALCDRKFEIGNLAMADDTQILNSLINNYSSSQNSGDGGTTFRFLLALRALQGNEFVLSGSDRMNERPIKPLVEALKELGSKIEYQDKEGFAPVRIAPSEMYGGKINIDSNVSSQFTSALMMIAPYLKGGLEINFSSEPVSFSYIKMTALLMKEFSADVIFVNNKIKVAEGKYIAKDFACSPDWSAASYWYGIIACLNDSEVTLKNLALDYFQQDAILKIWMNDFGVDTIQSGNNIILKSKHFVADKLIQLDFKNNPDLALSLAVVAAVKGIKVHFTGLSTLKFKESDRLSALKTELEKTGVTISIDDDSLQLSGMTDPEKIAVASFKTYNDHRMAMALSILATTNSPVKIENPEVVKKSYPDYFDQLKIAGFQIRYSEI